MIGEMLEKRLKFIRIPNLMFIVVVISSFVFLLDHVLFLQSGRLFLRSLFSFNSNLILKGQIWRVITFIFIPFSGGIISAALQAYCLYFLGTSLEVSLGERRFSLFYVFGVLLAIVAGFITRQTTVVFLNMSLIFVFSVVNPNRRMLLFFILPVNTLWIGALNAVFFIVTILVAIITKNFATLLAVLAALGNFLIFFGPHFFTDIFYNFKNFHEKSKRMYKNGKYWNN